MRRWVRTATEADYTTLDALYRSHGLPLVSERFFLEKIKRDEIFVALADQTILGYVVIDKESIQGLPYIHEPIIVATEEHHGFDTKLMMTAESYFKQLGLRKLLTSCSADDGQAITRNEQRGYVQSGVLSFVRQDGHNEVVMVKEIGNEDL